MNKREMIQYLKQNIPNFQGNDEEIEVKTALYIYVELGKIKSFDEKYYFGNSQTQKRIYHLAERQSKKVDEIAEKKKIICVSLTYKERRFLRVGISEMKDLEEKGLRLGAKPKENGANKLKNYINRQKVKESQNIEYK